VLDTKVADKIKALVRTEEERLSFEEDINTVAGRLYERKEFKIENLRGEVSESFYGLLEELLRAGLFPKQVNDRDKFLRAVKNFLESFETIRLTLAFSPSKDFLSKLSHYFASSGEKPVVLDILVNAEIGGGIVFENKGNYRDYSISEQLNSLLSDREFVTNLVKT